MFPLNDSSSLLMFGVYCLKYLKRMVRTACIFPNTFSYCDVIIKRIFQGNAQFIFLLIFLCSPRKSSVNICHFIKIFKRTVTKKVIVGHFLNKLRVSLKVTLMQICKSPYMFVFI